MSQVRSLPPELTCDVIDGDMEKRYECGCCDPPKSYTRSDKLYNHQKKYDPQFLNYFESEQRYNLSPKKCVYEGCDNPIPYRQSNRQKYCSSRCSAKATVPGRRKTKHVRQANCLACGGIFVDQNMPSRARKYCSVECISSGTSTRFCAKQDEKVKDWLAGKLEGSYETGELVSWAKNYVLKQANYSCIECGWSKVHPITGKIPVQVDHIDGDYRNNVIDNLRVLCPSCHSLTPTYGSLNMGNGRTYRVDRMNKTNT